MPNEAVSRVCLCKHLACIIFSVAAEYVTTLAGHVMMSSVPLFYVIKGKKYSLQSVIFGCEELFVDGLFSLAEALDDVLLRPDLKMYLSF